MATTKNCDELEVQRTKARLRMRKLRAFKRKSDIKKLVLPKPSNLWSKKDVSWDTRAPSSGRSNPDIILTMNKYKWFPHQAKSLRLYDPFFNTGAIKESYLEIGWQVDQIDHRHENCFEWFERRIKQDTLFLTNPPFLEDVLLSFFALLAHMDLPFILILRRGISETDYVGEFWDLMIQEGRSGDFRVRSFSRSFPMHNTEKTIEEGRDYVKGFAGLTIVTYYPKLWDWSPPDQLFERAIPKIDLHLPVRKQGQKVHKGLP